jgi:hypothetical protein
VAAPEASACLRKWSMRSSSRRMVMRVLPFGSGSGGAIRPRFPLLKSYCCFIGYRELRARVRFAGPLNYVDSVERD